MQLSKLCAICGNQHIVQWNQEWKDIDEADGRRKALLIQIPSNSVKKPESERELSIVAERIDDNTIGLTVGDVQARHIPDGGNFVEKRDCPDCGSRHTVGVDFDWPKPYTGVRMFFQSQSSKTDLARLEWLVPYARDGQHLTAKEKWSSDGRVMLQLVRRPIAGATVSETPPKKQTMADLKTKAAEIGLKVDKKWDEDQLKVAIEEHQAKITERATQIGELVPGVARR